MKHKSECPVCHNFNSQYLFSVDKGQLISCQSCYLVYYTPRPSKQELRDFYTVENHHHEFAQSLMSGEDFAEKRYLQFKKSLKKYAPFILTQSSPLLLDIGCGTGDFLRIASKNRWNIAGVEISPQGSISANQLLERNCVYTGDLLDLDLPDNYYDVITIFHVIEHLIDPLSTLKKIYQLLKPNGILFVETPNIGGFGAKIKKRNWSQIMPLEHITYFQPSSLRFSLEKAGFVENYTFTCSPTIIESIHGMSVIKKQLISLVYKIAPIFDLGVTLRSISVKS